jgi:hypothetical protein
MPKGALSVTYAGLTARPRGESTRPDLAVMGLTSSKVRCYRRQQYLAADRTALTDATPAMQRQLAPAFHATVADLGITSADDIRRRAGEAMRFLPRLWETTEAILSANRGISP